MNYTAGPWMQGIEESLEIVQNKQGGFTGINVAHVCHWAGIKREKAEANARLIAAAPELLEACKMVMMGYDLARKTMPVNMRVAVEQFVKPAIAKAE
jgi:hypothetical protein